MTRERARAMLRSWIILGAMLAQPATPQIITAAGEALTDELRALLAPADQ